MIITPAGVWKPSNLDNDGQWEDADNNRGSCANVSYTSYTQSNDVLNPILSYSQYKAPFVIFTDYVAFTKVATDDEFLFDIPELDTRKFDNH